MPIPATYDIKCILFVENEPGKTSGKSIDLPSFVKMMQTPKMQERLHNGMLMGLLTHDGRSRARQGMIPHHDWVMKDPDLCNIMREITVKDGVVYGYLDLTHTPAAERFKSLWKQGCKIAVSISTELHEGPDKFYIDECFGTDFTLRGENPSAQIIEANFSEGDPRRLDPNYDSKIQIGNFSVDPSETRIEDVHYADFSEKPVAKTPKSDFDTENHNEDSDNRKVSGSCSDFSIREYIRERQRIPAVVFKQRVREVIQYSRLSRAKTFNENKSMLRRYLLEYVNEWITRSLSDPKNDMNIALGLRLSEYCKDRMPMRNLQRYLKRAKQQMTSQGGVMTRDVQTNLNKSFAQMMGQIYDYINSKVNDKGKVL